MAFRVMVDDHFNYMDPEERYCSGEFADVDEAIARCREIVDDYLEATLTTATGGPMTAAALWDSYTSFGEDPFIITTAGEPDVGFSAWDYARAQCELRCGGVIAELPRKGGQHAGL